MLSHFSEQKIKEVEELINHKLVALALCTFVVELQRFNMILNGIRNNKLC